MNYNGATIPTPMNTEILKWAEKTRLLLEVAELPASVKFFNIVGTSYDTPFHTWYANLFLNPHNSAFSFRLRMKRFVVACSYGSKEHPIEQLTDILALEVRVLRLLTASAPFLPA